MTYRELRLIISSFNEVELDEQVRISGDCLNSDLQGQDVMFLPNDNGETVPVILADIMANT